MAKGGARLGAGRRKGGKNAWSLRDYFTNQDIADLVKHVKIEYVTDNKIAIALLKYLFSEAPKELTVDGNYQIEVNFVLHNRPALPASQTNGDIAGSAQILGSRDGEAIRKDDRSA